MVTHGRRVGLAGAALVAFSNYHVFWSQDGRMFMMASFLGLLSTLLLLLLMRRAGHSAPESRSEPGDHIFVRPSNWITPMFYHLADDRFVFTSDGFDKAVGDFGARVWLVFSESDRWGWYGTTSDEMLEAVSGLRLAETVEARRARAEIYGRD
jgi:hypothetical protein